MDPTQDENLNVAKEKAWRKISAIDAALEAGAIDEAGWHAAMLDIVEPAYLAGVTPHAQSGYSGDASRWESARRLILDAIDRKGTFLDVGCANGLLMESMYAWSRADGTPVEPYGVEISTELTGLARRRLPQWADRIWCANVLDFDPGRRFTYVRSGLEYVPSRRAEDLIDHLLELTEPGGHVIIGTYNEERHLETQAELIERLGFNIAGTSVRPHRNPAIAYKALWLAT